MEKAHRGSVLSFFFVLPSAHKRVSARRDGEGEEREACPNSYDSKRMNFLTLSESSPSCNYLVEGQVCVRSNRVFFLKVMSSSSQKQNKKEGEGVLVKANRRELCLENDSRAADRAPVSFVYVQCRPHRPKSVVRTQEETSLRFLSSV